MFCNVAVNDLFVVLTTSMFTLICIDFDIFSVTDESLDCLSHINVHHSRIDDFLFGAAWFKFVIPEVLRTFCHVNKYLRHSPNSNGNKTKEQWSRFGTTNARNKRTSTTVNTYHVAYTVL